MPRDPIAFGGDNDRHRAEPRSARRRRVEPLVAGGVAVVTWRPFASTAVVRFNLSSIAAPMVVASKSRSLENITNAPRQKERPEAKILSLSGAPGN